MRIIELSNHPGDMLANVTLRRQVALKRAEVQRMILRDHGFHDRGRR